MCVVNEAPRVGKSDTIYNTIKVKLIKLTEIIATHARGSWQQTRNTLQTKECIGEGVRSLIVQAIECAIMLAITTIRWLCIAAVRVLAGALTKLMFLMEGREIYISLEEQSIYRSIPNI